MTSILSDSIIWSRQNGATISYSTQTLTNQQIMDLISAKKDVIAKSKKEPKVAFFLNVDDDGEVTVSKEFDKNSSAACYKNGSEIAMPEETKASEPKVKGKTPESKKEEQSKQTKMSTKKAVAKPTKKVATASKDWGKKVDISIKQMRANLKKGFVYRDSQGIRHWIQPGFESPDGSKWLIEYKLINQRNEN